MSRCLRVVLFALLALGPLALWDPADAKGPHQRGSDSQSDPQKAAKAKATEKAYQDALKRIPDQNVKVDPWGTMR